jgi:pilus assembly protein CpaE
VELTMARRPSLVIIGAQPAEEQVLRQQIGDLMEVLGTEPEPGKGLDAVRRLSPSIALLYLDHHPDEILALSSHIAQSNGCAPVIVSRDRNPDQILRAMRAGAKDFAFLEAEGVDVRRVLLDHSLTPSAENQPTHLGKVIVVFSCKGGCGATTIATNLAGALLPEDRKQPGQVVLLDLNFQMGDVLAFLDLTSRYTWQDLVRNMHRLDEDLLRQSLTLHPYGVHVVAQSDVLEEADELTPKSVGTAIALLRRHFEFCVIDGIRDFGELSLLVLDLADKILLTMTQDIPALKNANRCLSIFNRLGYDRDKVKLVLNRFGKRGDLDPDSIEDALGTPISGTVSNDFPTVIKAVNEGSLLVNIAPKAPVTRDIRGLVPLVRGEPPAAKRGFFGLRGTKG